MKNKIFISHATQDKYIVESFVDNILKLGLGINKDLIFCSSMEGHGIKSGKYIPQTIRDELLKSKISFLMISRNYRNSEVCQNELGASWVLLPEEKVIPIIIDSISYEEMGFLNKNKLGLRSDDSRALLKMIQDNINDFSNEFNLELINKYINVFVELQKGLLKLTKVPSDFSKCYTISLYPFAEISQRNLPELSNEIFHTPSQEIINSIFKDLSSKDFKKQLMYSYSGGDNEIDKIERLKNGSWLVGCYELNIKELWFNINDSMHREFILVKTEPLPPFQIDSNGKEDFSVGVMDDGTVISLNEYYNGYARINGEIIKIKKDKSRVQHRFDKPLWFFVATRYHNIIYNHDKTRNYLTQEEKGNIKVDKKSLEGLMTGMRMHPVVLEHY